MPNKFFSAFFIVGIFFMNAAANGTETSRADTNKSSGIRVAAFNVSMDATNYLPAELWAEQGADALKNALAEGHPQLRGVAEVIQRTRPDILVLNEFDYLPADVGIQVFLEKYLGESQQGAEPIHYPYFYLAPVNTGVPSGFDLNRDGKKDARQNDAWGFGFYEGHYAMVIVSRYPIITDEVRTFQHFLWKDMPGALLPEVPDTGEAWYSDDILERMPLSSKSHWDVPVQVGDKQLHVLVSHPTPPVFDGPEDRNGKRNHDEVRFWADYVTPGQGEYIYDDTNTSGGLAKHQRFVIAGDLNASVEGDENVAGTIEQLLDSPMVQAEPIPASEGGAAHSPESTYGKYHTAGWRKRADYVLPSKFGIEVEHAGVFWPTEESELARLVENREATSDHRLVWIDIKLTD